MAKEHFPSLLGQFNAAAKSNLINLKSLVEIIESDPDSSRNSQFGCCGNPRVFTSLYTCILLFDLLRDYQEKNSALDLLSQASKVSSVHASICAVKQGQIV